MRTTEELFKALLDQGYYESREGDGVWCYSETDQAKIKERGGAFHVYYTVQLKNGRIKHSLNVHFLPSTDLLKEGTLTYDYPTSEEVWKFINTYKPEPVEYNKFKVTFEVELPTVSNTTDKQKLSRVFNGIWIEKIKNLQVTKE